ncbi:MAG: Uma2 family endonuclease [Hyphomicrobiaceae bacterium]|nr:Uma2 family endonuclease [Hyphomicrobiaceae bacterium]
MNARLDLTLDKATFDHWLLDQERKYEWKEGRVVQMTDVTRGHASIVMNIALSLAARLDREKWRIVASDFGVEGQGFVRFPDVLVEPADAGDMSSRRTDKAVLLFEVLSPTSVDTDMLEKPQEYLSLAPLEAYVVASQDAAICWLWQRDATTRSFTERPLRIDGRDRSIEFTGRGIALPLAEIYRGITTTDD